MHSSRATCVHGGTCGSRRVVFYSRRFSEKLKTTAPLVRICYRLTQRWTAFSPDGRMVQYSHRQNRIGIPDSISLYRLRRQTSLLT